MRKIFFILPASLAVRWKSHPWLFQLPVGQRRFGQPHDFLGSFRACEIRHHIPVPLHPVFQRAVSPNWVVHSSGCRTKI